MYLCYQNPYQISICPEYSYQTEKFYLSSQNIKHCTVSEKPWQSKFEIFRKTSEIVTFYISSAIYLKFLLLRITLCECSLNSNVTFMQITPLVQELNRFLGFLKNFRLSTYNVFQRERRYYIYRPAPPFLFLVF